MRTLVIDSATRACSVALVNDGRLIDQRFEVIGRGHAERLVPMIAELPEQGKAQRIAVNVGPGSFTGIRIGVAAARALGLAWQAETAGYSSLALVAAIFFEQHADIGEVGCAMVGGHGELFVAQFDRSLAEITPLTSKIPADAATYISCQHVAGEAAQALVDARGRGEAHMIWPDAAHYPLLADLPALPCRPVYGRAPDAQVPGAGPVAPQN